MKVAIEGSRTFDDYPIFMRSMGVALSTLKYGPEELTVYSAGPHRINNFLAGFVNLTEAGMKGRGMAIKYRQVPHAWLRDHISEMDYFIYLARPHEKWSTLAALAEAQEVEVGIFQY